MPKQTSMRWLETRAGTSGTLSNITAGTYLLNEFNTNGDNVQARSDYGRVYGIAFYSATEGVLGDVVSATNSQNPQTITKCTSTSNLTNTNGNGMRYVDFRANTLGNVFSRNEDVKARLSSSGTTSEVMACEVFVTDYNVVPTSVGQRVDRIIKCDTSGTVSTSIANFALTPDNELEAGNYRIVKADVCSIDSSNTLIHSGLVLKGLPEAVPLVPRSAVSQDIPTINNLPVESNLIFNSVSNFPSINLIGANSASSAVDVTLYLQRVS